MKKIIYIFTLLAVSFGFVSCEPEFDNPLNDDVYHSGDADFSTYVAVGNSLTAGYTNGTLYKSAQSMSFPKLVSDQMKLAGGGEFTQPYLEDDINDVGGLLLMGNVIAAPKLVIDASQGSVEPINKTPTIEVSNIHPGPYNNMGVPGAKSFHLLAPGYGNLANIAIGKANPYFVRMASNSNAMVIQDAVAQQPTFFTLWIGNNDVLSYATSGGTGTNQAGNQDVSTYGPNDITDPGVFAYVYQQLLDALTAGGAKGVVSTIPDVSSIPFFTTIPYNPIPLTDQPVVDALNGAYAQYNQGLQQLVALSVITPEEAAQRTISFSLGANALVIEDETLTDLTGYGLPSIRQATSEDLILLTAKAIIGKPDPNNPQLINGLTIPLADNWVLIPQEITDIRTATTAFNAAIEQLADIKDLAVADMAAMMQKLHDRLATEDGSIYTADYFNGTNMDQVSFSLDGVHPNPRGYAITANEFIKVINAKYNANLPLVNPSYYPTIPIVPVN
jgi:lysophospholipase L1-like esterase